MLRFSHFKHPVPHKHPQVGAFVWLSFFVSAGKACFQSMFPIILLSRVGSEAGAGMYLSMLAVVALITCLTSSWLFVRFSKVHILISALSLAMIAVACMTFAAHFWQIAGLDIPRAVALIIATISMQLFLVELSPIKELSIQESRYYTFSNLGWVVGPLLGGLAATQFGRESVFLTTSGFYGLSLVFFLHQHFVVKHPAIHHGKHPETLRSFWTHLCSFFGTQEYRRIFLMALGLFFWWVVLLSYVPMAITTMGYSEQTVGWIISIGAGILLLTERYIGRAATKHSLRPFLITGYALLMLMCLGFFFGHQLPVLLLVLFALSNIGATFIEPLTETYFFKAVPKSKREKYFGLYNTASPLISIVAPFCISLLFLNGGSYEALWLLSALVFGALAMVACTIPRKY